jgi:hypothetical protein
MAVRRGTCGLVAYYTPDRCPRCGGETFDEVAAPTERPATAAGETAVGVVLAVVAVLSVVAGCLMLAVRGEPGAVRFLGSRRGLASPASAPA